MTRAFVFTGGGSLGAVQAGMLLALAEAEVRPDLVVGTSVGAINAAWYANQPDATGAERLTDIWRGVHRHNVFPLDLLQGFLGFVGLRDSLVSATALRHLLEAHIDYTDLEDAELPVHLVATDLKTGMEVVLSSGDVSRALQASAAIPGVFPPVEIDGRLLVDGGVVDNAAISVAVHAGATEIWVLPTGYACALDRPPRGALGTAMQSLTLLVHHGLDDAIAHFGGSATIHVAPPLCPLAVSPVDFSHSAELIDRAEESTRAWLESGAFDVSDPRRVLAFHEHHAHGLSQHAPVASP